MRTINIVKTIKEIHPSCIVLVKIGTFYNVYGKDSYILSYLLRYKIIEKEELPICAFPISSISKVENILEKNKINYIAVDRRNNYDEEQKVINKQENNYNKIYEQAKKSVNTTLRIQRIYQNLIKDRDNIKINEKLDKIEKIRHGDGEFVLTVQNRKKTKTNCPSPCLPVSKK